MTFFPLINDERERLKRLNQDKAAVFALKKLFLNVCIENPASNEALTKINKAFHELEVIQPESRIGKPEGNMV